MPKLKGSRFLRVDPNSNLSSVITVRASAPLNCSMIIHSPLSIRAVVLPRLKDLLQQVPFQIWDQVSRILDLTVLFPTS
jgi:hypothetical protein